MPSAEGRGRSTGLLPLGAATDVPQFRQVGDEVVQQGWAITFNRTRFVGPDGETFERDVVRHPGAVAVVPVTDRDTVVVVRQFRPALDRWIVEIPAGTRDVDGEPPETTARRELIEEVGFAAAELSLLTRCANTPGFCDEITAIYLATGLTAVPLDRQGIEESHMTVHEIPLDEFDGLVDDGTVIDAQTILGVGLARRHLGNRQLGNRQQESPTAGQPLMTNAGPAAPPAP